jgi:hypothetical protein
MTASEIIARARSVSDLPASQFVSHTDELNSINESWKDIYNALIEADDDYYLTEITIALTPANIVAGTNNEYLFPLPADFLKMRYLDFKLDSQNYLPVKKFNLSMKDDQPGDPYYRIKGTNLWVIGGAVPATGLTLRMGYYPSVQTITAPAPLLTFGSALTPQVLGTASMPYYIDANQGLLYVRGNDIWYESLTLNSTTNLLTSLAPLRPTYYKGYLYFITAANISRGIFNPGIPAAVTAAAITIVGGILSFTIFDNLIYFTTATQVFTCNLDGTNVVLLSALAVDDVSLLGVTGVGVLVARVVATNTVVSLTSPSIATNVLHLASDRTYLYTLTTDFQVHKLTVTVVGTNVTVTNDTVIHPDAVYIGNTDGSYLAVQDEETQALWGFPLDVDFSFSYPNNLVPEIMAWRSAIDYRVKQQADISTHMMKLGHPTNSSEGPAIGLWARFEQTIKRDEYQPERIRNAYPNRSWYAR